MPRKPRPDIVLDYGDRPPLTKAQRATLTAIYDSGDDDALIEYLTTFDLDFEFTTTDGRRVDVMREIPVRKNKESLLALAAWFTEHDLGRLPARVDRSIVARALERTLGTPAYESAPVQFRLVVRR